MWFALPFTVGPTVSETLAELSYPVRTLSSLGLWGGWAVGMVASCVAHPLALTALRILAPAAAAATGWAALHDHLSPLATGWALVAAAWVLSPAFGEWCVNGPAYPNERRYLLRIPGPTAGGVLGIVLAWDLAVAGLGAGPGLLAARQWVAGAVVTVVGLPLAWVFLRSLHGLSRRWVVFVPAGVVLHDPMTLRDPVLFPRRTITSLGPTSGDPATADLTQRAVGLALELRLREPMKLTLMRFGQRLGQTVDAASVAFTPTRPGTVVEEARRRNLPLV